MKSPRVLSMLFAVVMLLTCCFGTKITTVVASTAPTFTVTNGFGSPGDDVTVTVDISNNPGICTATIWIHYDEGLTLKSVTDTELLVGGLFGGNKSANPYGLGWDDSANFDGNNGNDGTLATLVFTIDETAANGDYDVWVTYNSGDIYNIALEEFEFDTVAGKITVTDAACPHLYTNYVSNSDATYKADGTETAKCDHGCGATDTRTEIGSKLIDTTLPTGEIKIKENRWKSFVNTITFGLFCKEKFDVTIIATDYETGIKSVEYHKSSTPIAETDIIDVTDWTTGNAFSVESEGQYVIYVKLIDNADNIAYINTDGIVLDTTAPVIGGIVNGESYYESKTFTVADDHLDTVTVNGTPVTEYELAAVNTAGTEYTIIATDKAGHSTTITVTVAVKNSILYGDLDMDGSVRAADALLSLQFAVGKIDLIDDQIIAADVDGKDGISANDALVILQYAVNKITLFPIESI